MLCEEVTVWLIHFQKHPEVKHGRGDGDDASSRSAATGSLRGGHAAAADDGHDGQPAASSAGLRRGLAASIFHGDESRPAPASQSQPGDALKPGRGAARSDSYAIVKTSVNDLFGTT